MDKYADPAIVAIPRSKQQTLDHIVSIQSQRTAKQKATFRTKYGTRQNFNALLELPLDLHQYICERSKNTSCIFLAAHRAPGITSIFARVLRSELAKPRVRRLRLS